MTDEGRERCPLFGSMEWILVDHDREGFLNFLEEVGTILAGPEPQADPNCSTCTWQYKRRLVEKQSA
jgi:hypothetical protein